MKRKATGVFNILLIVVFVNFVIANTIFTHTHRCFDGHLVTHSHPYLPSAHHSHSQQAMDSIASFNAMAASMEAVTSAVALSVDASYVVVTDQNTCRGAECAVQCTGLRGPPQYYCN